MATNILELLGTIRPDGSLVLDQKLEVPPGRVRVRVESVTAPEPPAETLMKFVERTRRELATAGHKFMNDEEVMAWIEEMRADDDRIEDLYRHAEEEKRRQEAPHLFSDLRLVPLSDCTGELIKPHRKV